MGVLLKMFYRFKEGGMMSIFTLFRDHFFFPDDEYACSSEHTAFAFTLRHRYAVTSDTRYAIVAHSVTARSALMVVIQRQLERYYWSVEST